MSQLQVVELDVDVEQARQTWQSFERFKAKLMTSDDRYEIDGAQRLNRQGCAKLATVFGLSEPEPPQIETQQLGDKHIGFVATAMVEAPDGRRAYGVAACSTTEQQSKNPKNVRAFHDAVAVAHTRAKERAVADLVGGGEVTAEEIGFNEPNSNGQKAATAESSKDESIPF